MVLTYRRTHARIRYPSNKTSNAACQKKCFDLKIVCACCSMGDKCTKYILCLFTRCFPCAPYCTPGAKRSKQALQYKNYQGKTEIPSSLGLQILTFLGLFSSTPLDPTPAPTSPDHEPKANQQLLSETPGHCRRSPHGVSPHGISAAVASPVDSSSVRSQSDQSPSIFKIDSLWSDSASTYC